MQCFSEKLKKKKKLYILIPFEKISSGNICLEIIIGSAILIVIKVCDLLLSFTSNTILAA